MYLHFIFMQIWNHIGEIFTGPPPLSHPNPTISSFTVHRNFQSIPPTMALLPLLWYDWQKVQSFSLILSPSPLFSPPPWEMNKPCKQLGNFAVQQVKIFPQFLSLSFSFIPIFYPLSHPSFYSFFFPPLSLLFPYLSDIVAISISCSHHEPH